MHYILDPEVAGHIDENSIADFSVHPPIISKLVYQFDGWLGDELLESFPCYIITEKLANELSQNNLTGFTLEQVKVNKSQIFQDLHKDKELPKFKWLKVLTSKNNNDFNISEENRLLVSEKALQVLKNGTLKNCDIHEVTL